MRAGVAEYVRVLLVTVERPGTVHHNNKRQTFGPDAFSYLSTFVGGLLVGCAIDATQGTMHFLCRDEHTGKVECALGFEGMQFEGGLIPAVSTIIAELDVRLNGCELLEELREQQEGTQLAGYLPISHSLTQWRRGVHGPNEAISREREPGWLVPSSGHDHLFFSDAHTISCNSFLCSLTAPQLPCRAGGLASAIYYEVHLITLGGAGTSSSFDFDPEAKNYNHNRDPSDVSNTVAPGGPGAIGWGSASRFHGEYHVGKGVGHKALSWGMAGAMLRRAASEAGKRQEEAMVQYAAFLSADPRPSEQEWMPSAGAKPPDDYAAWVRDAAVGDSAIGADPEITRPEWAELAEHATWPLWQPGGVVGCGISVRHDGGGTIEYYYDGRLCFSQEVRAPLLRGGVVPALSLHSNFQVRVNLGQEQFVEGRDPATGDLVRKKEPPRHYVAALRSQLNAAQDGGGAESVAPKKSQREKHLPKSRSRRAEPRDLEQLVMGMMEEERYENTLGSARTDEGERVQKSLRQLATHAQTKSRRLMDAAAGVVIDDRIILDLEPKHELELDEQQLFCRDGDLGMASFDEELIKAIFDVLERIPEGVQVQELRFRSCKIKPDNIEVLAQRIEAQTALCSLDLSHNTLYAEGVTTLALHLRSLNDTALNEIDVSSNDIKDSGVAALCCNLSAPTDPNSGTGVRVLKLAQNSISPMGARSISQALVRLPLKELILDHNRIEEAGAQVLAEALKTGASASFLEKLSLSDNGLLDAGVAALAEGLSRNSALTCLHLGSGNYINGDGLRCLAQKLRGNKRSRLCQLRLNEPRASQDDSVDLIFSMKRAVLATSEQPGVERVPEVYVGSLVRGNHQCQPPGSHEPQQPAALHGQEAVRFFRGPLSYCVQTLATPARLSELAEYLIRDRRSKADASYVKPADAQAAVIEAILLRNANDREAMLRSMIGKDCGYGVHRFFLHQQQTCLAQLTTPSTEGQGPGDVLHARSAKLGGLWLQVQRVKWTSIGSSPPSRGTEIVSMELSAALQSQQLEFTQAELESYGLRHLRPDSFIRTTRRTAQIAAGAGHAQRSKRDEGAALYFVLAAPLLSSWSALDVFVPSPRDYVQRDVELFHDLWLTAHPLFPNTEAFNLLLVRSQLAVANARTALLVAIHAGHQDAAKLLVDRLGALRCHIFNSATRRPDDNECPVLLVKPNQSAKEKLTRRSAELPDPQGELILLQHPDVVGIGAAEHDETGGYIGVEALRAAAVRGMAEVVTALLDYRTKHGLMQVDRDTKVPCHHVAGLMGMHANDAHNLDGRTLLHDACRHLLPHGDSQLAPLSEQLVSFVSQILQLELGEAPRHGRKAPKGRNLKTGQVLAWQEEWHTRRLALHYAAAFGHSDLIKLLLDVFTEAHEHEARCKQRILNACDEEGWTPLALATSNGHLRACRLLVEAGADPMAPLMTRSLGGKREPTGAQGEGVLDEESALGREESARAHAKVPCAFAISLLRIHFEETIRPAVVTKSQEQDGRQPHCQVTQVANKLDGVLHKVANTVDGISHGVANRIDGIRQGHVQQMDATSHALARAADHSSPLSPGKESRRRGQEDESPPPSATGRPRSAPGQPPLAYRTFPSRTARSSLRSLWKAERFALNENSSRLIDQLVGERGGLSLIAMRRMQVHAQAIHAVILQAPGVAVRGRGLAPYNARLFRRFFLYEDSIRMLCSMLLYLVLLTIVVLYTSGAGMLFRTSSFGVSYPFVLQTGIGGLVSSEAFNQAEENGLFNQIDQIKALTDFLDPTEASPLFAHLLSNDTGFIDPQNALLGAVRLRLERVELQAQRCPTSWLAEPLSICADAGGWSRRDGLDTSDFVGAVSGHRYAYCADGVFCHPSAVGILDNDDGDAASDKASGISFASSNGTGITSVWRSHLGSVWPAKWFSSRGYSGHVLDLPPRDPPQAQALVRGVLDDRLLDDGASRALFIDYTIYNHPLSFAVVVHLTVEIPPTGRMISRTDAIALPLGWPFEGAGWCMVIFEIGVIASTLVRLWSELATWHQNARAGRTHFDKWNFIDMVGLVCLFLWIVSRLMWWIALVAWSGLDATTDEYVGWMQPLAKLIWDQRAISSVAIIFAWFSVFQELKQLPNVGPLLTAFLETIFSAEVGIFILLVFGIVIFFAIGCHVGFGGDVAQFSTFFGAYLNVFAAFFGDWDKDALIVSDTHMSEGSPGAIMWLLMAVFGLAMLSNVFIAVIGNTYDELRKNHLKKWETKANKRMSKEVWLAVERSLPNNTGPLAELISLAQLEVRRSRFRELRRRLYSSTVGNLLAWVMLGRRRSELELVHVNMREGTVLASDTEREALRQLEKEHRPDSSDVAQAIRDRWFAQPSAPKDKDAAPCNSRWYDDEVRLRFHFSWCVLPRFDAAVVEGEGGLGSPGSDEMGATDETG